MKLWRKMAMKQGKKDGVGPGRQIKRMMQQLDSKSVRVTANGSISIQPQNKSMTLLEALFKRAGIKSLEEQNPVKEVANEAV